MASLVDDTSFSYRSDLIELEQEEHDRSTFSSEPYANVEQCPNQQRRTHSPNQHRFVQPRPWWHRESFINFITNFRPSSMFSSSFRSSFSSSNSSSHYFPRPPPHASPHAYHCGRMKKLRLKQFRRNKVLAKVLALTVIVLLATVALLQALKPEVIVHVAQHLNSLLEPQSTLQCQFAMHEHFPEDRYRHCHRGGGGGGSGGGGSGKGALCTIDVETALCLIMKTKANLDHRTRNLHVALDNLTESLLPRLTNETDGNDNSSAIYIGRPRIHLSFYYSAEADQERVRGVHALQWRESSPGLASRRHVETLPPPEQGNNNNDENEAIFGGFRITHPGYYYVYSQLSFQDGDMDSDSSWINRPLFWPLHAVRKNDRNILKSTVVFDTKESLLTGIFLLTEGDKVTVEGDYTHLDKMYLGKTFFGAYRV